jgi:PAS domain S-box-containing protein
MNYLKQELYELVRSDERIFDLIQDASLDGLWYCDTQDPENEWMNPQFWKTLGYDPEKMPHKASAWQKIIHPDDLKVVQENFEKHCADPNHPYDQVVRFTHRNGSTVWIRRRGRAMRNADGKVTRMLGSHLDVTKEKVNEEKYRILFDSIDEGFCIIEMIFDEKQKPIDYRFLSINASFERQTGMHDAEGKRMREFAPDHEEHWFETYGRIALTGESIRFENVAEQLHRWYDVYAFRFGDPKNMQVAILFNDISERRKAENMILELNKELADNLREIAEVNKELEAFSYSVSHDLRAPLRAINGYAGIIKEDFWNKIPDGAKESIESISRNSMRMGMLIDDLLTFSRLGRKDVQRNEVDTADIVETIISDICRQYSANREIFKTADLLPAQGDATLLKQVWVNLISNAHKYSQKNPSPSIEIGSTKSENGIIYHIKDNGVGFDMKYYNQLFGVFHRLHNNEEFEGTGVGLAIVDRIVTRHGGKVWAEAELGKGASFYFTIPVG